MTSIVGSAAQTHSATLGPVAIGPRKMPSAGATASMLARDHITLSPLIAERVEGAADAVVIELRGVETEQHVHARGAHPVLDSRERVRIEQATEHQHLDHGAVRALRLRGEQRSPRTRPCGGSGRATARRGRTAPRRAPRPGRQARRNVVENWTSISRLWQGHT